MKRLLFPVLLLPILAFAQGGLPVNPYIYVDGKAEIQKAADLVKISFDVVARASDVAKANAEVQAKAARVFDLLKRHKIADNDVIAESLRSEPEFENEQSYVRRGKVVGFSVSRRFDVKIRDVTAFPKLVDELIAGVNAEFSVVASGVSNEREMQDQLWEKALKNAREQADKVLKTTNMKIDSVFAVSPVPFPEIRTRIFGSDERGIITGSNIPMTEPEYRLAPVTVSQEIHVIYLISPAK